jgi:hypothetical protein
VAQYNSVVTSKTPAWSRVARQLFLKDAGNVCHNSAVFLHVNAGRIKYDSSITSRYSGVISKNNGNAGHEYKLSIDYKRTTEKQRRYSEQAEIFFNIL